MLSDVGNPQLIRPRADEVPVDQIRRGGRFWPGPSPLVTRKSFQVGKVYCAVVLDAFSRKVVGWSIDNRQDAALVTNALGMALHNRQLPGGTVIHSDHGVQFTSWAFTKRAKDCGLLPSMGSVGGCYDNAMFESFWGRMQTELLDR